MEFMLLLKNMVMNKYNFMKNFHTECTATIYINILYILVLLENKSAE